MKLDENKGGGKAVWLLRGLTLLMMVSAIFIASRKFRTTPEQEELGRYTEFTVPAYLGEVAQVEARLDRLWQAPGPTREEARALLVDEVMPLVIKAKKHAASVNVQAESVKISNAEYLAALERLMEVGRTGVRVLDDPAVSGEDGFRAVRTAQRSADDSIRAWMGRLRERCAAAGFQMKGPAAGPTATK